MAADTVEGRRTLLVTGILDARREGQPVTFEAEGVELEYDDRTIRLELDAEQRDRLDALLSTYHVFKIKQPETRRAADGVVYLSAVTDAKHAADFVDAAFREVYELGGEYALNAVDEA
ncbi:hypothetical protein [Natronomonas salsuginis]|uniref:DUF7975 domain-containing protein n=1 Tax=Natronomonas salsuginis TaxID=2217661 RepID=A0A4U5JCT8_9EURY|nr:hypothetical protein [Natronomonas salsuginis]TKR26066.1 hypothetical protein DM868_06115 [Natronomonas salsuginis]